jgi:hypothetical protein
MVSCGSNMHTASIFSAALIACSCRSGSDTGGVPRRSSSQAWLEPRGRQFNSSPGHDRSLRSRAVRLTATSNNVRSGQVSPERVVTETGIRISTALRRCSASGPPTVDGELDRRVTELLGHRSTIRDDATHQHRRSEFVAGLSVAPLELQKPTVRWSACALSSPVLRYALHSVLSLAARRQCPMSRPRTRRWHRSVLRCHYLAPMPVFRSG